MVNGPGEPGPLRGSWKKGAVPFGRPRSDAPAVAAVGGASSSGAEIMVLAFANVRTDFWLLVHEDLRHTARVRAFADFIFAELSKVRGRMEGCSLSFLRHREGPCWSPASERLQW
jgi:hypothetical protein